MDTEKQDIPSDPSEQVVVEGATMSWTPPPKFLSYGIGFVRRMFKIILREARGPIHHQFVSIARYVAKGAI